MSFVSLVVVQRRYKQIETALAEQRTRDSVPLGIQRIRRHELTRAVIPICGVSEIAFFPVQVGVDPRAGPVLDAVCHLVCFIPVALRVVPQRLKRRRDRWR